MSYCCSVSVTVVLSTTSSQIQIRKRKDFFVELLDYTRRGNRPLQPNMNEKAEYRAPRRLTCPKATDLNTGKKHNYRFGISFFWNTNAICNLFLTLLQSCSRNFKDSGWNKNGSWHTVHVFAQFVQPEPKWNISVLVPLCLFPTIYSIINNKTSIFLPEFYKKQRVLKISSNLD